MSQAGSYEAPEFDPPYILLSMGSMLRLRGGHSTSFADLLSPNRDDQHNYVEGLLLVAYSFIVFFAAWMLVLLVLRLKGREVGCASGRAFEIEKVDERFGIGSTDSSDSYSASFDEESTDEPIESSATDHEKKNRDSGSIGSHHSFEKSFDGDHDGGSYVSEDDWIQAAQGAAANKRIIHRERRTRFCFMVFSCIALLCVPTILVYAFGPMKEATRATDDILLLATDALVQVSASIHSIDSAAEGAVDVVNATPTAPEIICPQIREGDIQTELGVNLAELVYSVSDEFDAVYGQLMLELDAVKNIVQSLETGIIRFEDSMSTGEDYMWIIPGLLFAVSLLTACAMLGVLLAWKDKSGTRVQNIMSYFVLPLLIVVSGACWVAVSVTSVGTMLSADLCTPGGSSGSPDDTIQEVLRIHELDHNSTTYKYATAYTNSCIGPDPTDSLIELEYVVQQSIDSIWRQISRIDSIGRARLIEQCGGDSLQDLFSGARNLAKLLSTIRRSIDSTSGSLACPRMNPIYNAVAHHSVCTLAASSVAISFLLFFILALATLVMISLRASFLRHKEEERVYHDESEVVENMILDEHEEYLAYISKYKHEWQEYNGFDSASMLQSNGDNSSYDDDGSQEGSQFLDEEERADREGYNGSEEYSEGGSDSSGPSRAGLDVEIFPSSKYAPSVDDGAKACAIDEISFPSLSVRQSDESASIGEDDFFALPSPLLPPTENRDGADDTPDPILIPPTEVQVIGGPVQSVIEEGTEVQLVSGSPVKRTRTSRSKSSKASIASPVPKRRRKKAEAVSQFFDKYGSNPYGEKEDPEPSGGGNVEETRQDAPGELTDKYDTPTSPRNPPPASKNDAIRAALGARPPSSPSSRKNTPPPTLFTGGKPSPDGRRPPLSPTSRPPPSPNSRPSSPSAAQRAKGRSVEVDVRERIGDSEIDKLISSGSSSSARGSKASMASLGRRASAEISVDSSLETKGDYAEV